MPPRNEQINGLIPSWIIEQDYFVFLSLFGWLLVGLLAWTKPLSDNEGRRLPWLWFGFYAFSQAISDFLRTLSFSDPFFRAFNMEVGFEMLGYGLLVESAIRSLPRYRGKSFFPYAALAGLFLGLSIEIGDVLYTLVVSFLVSVLAVAWACRSFVAAAREEKRPELYGIVVGLVFVLPTWLLAPDRLSFVQTGPAARFEDFPEYGFSLLLLRILAAWTVLAGFWAYRLQRRIEDVAPQIKDELRFWGYRVLPGTLCVVVLASYLITSWNGERTRDRLEREYLFRSQTAALAMDARGINDMSVAEIEEEVKTGAIASQLLAIKRVGTDVRSVYLWSGDSTQVRTLSFNQSEYGRPVIQRAYPFLAREEAVESGEAFVLGPLAVDRRALLNVSSPIATDLSGDVQYWLGIDLVGNTWLQSISLSRLQSIIIAGLILALVIFFLYYQIDHESEADLVLAKERAEAADRAKSEFLAVISHEIRTPLQSVLGYSDLLRGTPLNDKQRSCLDTIQSEGKILLRIVQDILDFSNLRKANFELKEGPVRLRRLVEETFRTIKPMADRKGLTASLEIASNVPDLVLADGVRLRQVLLNLFGNSVKYTDQGSVTLSALVVDNEELEAEAIPSANGLAPMKFVISDTGVGIKKADLSRLFEPFIQLEHTGTSPREGAGLGLAIVNRIVELMGGRIEVQSEFGAGSEFTVRFSFEQLEAADEPGERSLLATGGEIEEARLGSRYPMRIAVVDDNPMVRRLIAQYLESLGYEPDLLDGGRPAAERGDQYDLLLMDLRMPEIDGPKAASMIRERSESATRPWIIAISASLQEEEVERAMNAGVNDFLGKPFFAPELADKLRSVPHFESFAASERLPTDERQSSPQEHVPIFIGPADDRGAVGKTSETIASADETGDPESKSGPTTVFGGIGSYPAEAVRAAVSEVYVVHDEMQAARLAEDWHAIREKAHYLSNTAMALGIDQLYLDSKALQSAAEEASIEKIDKYLPELRLNFEYWEQSEEG